MPKYRYEIYPTSEPGFFDLRYVCIDPFDEHQQVVDVRVRQTKSEVLTALDDAL